MEEKEIQELKQHFIAIDEKGDGFIKLEIVKEAVAKLIADEEKVATVMQQVNSEHYIKYHEFISGALSAQKVLTDERIEVVYDKFNTARE